MSTIKQVSALANVSLATVSRVINTPDKVKASTRVKVHNAMAELGYRHNTIAASLASNKTNSIGYVIPELHGFFGTMMSGTEAILRKANKHLFIASGHSDARLEKEAIENLCCRRCDALILHVEAVEDDYLVDLANQDIPFVIVNRYIDEIKDRCIALDNVLGGYLATEMLLQNGHRNIAYIAGSLWKADGRDRLNGHIKALQSFNLAYDPRLTVEGNFQSQSGLEAISHLLSKHIPFSAIVCGNDEMASGAIEGLRQHQRHVPNDISIVGYDNVEFSRYMYPKLTTVNYPAQVIGQLAAKWILGHVYQQHNEDIPHLIEPSLIIRDSVICLDTNS